MAKTIPASCARPSGGPVEDQATEQQDTGEKSELKSEEETMVSISQKAPDFTAPAYHQGEFVNVNLSDYFGKWILLCFYPGDFTFV